MADSNIIKVVLQAVSDSFVQSLNAAKKAVKALDDSGQQANKGLSAARGGVQSISQDLAKSKAVAYHSPGAIA